MIFLLWHLSAASGAGRRNDLDNYHEGKNSKLTKYFVLHLGRLSSAQSVRQATEMIIIQT